MQERTIIDGQQRLTTFQLMFDALHAELILHASSLRYAQSNRSSGTPNHFVRQPKTDSRSGLQTGTGRRSTR